MSASLRVPTDTVALVNIITQLKRKDQQKGRYILSFIVSPTDQTSSFVTKDELEHEIHGGCSHDIELVSDGGCCEVQFSISGALEPLTVLDKGEDIIKYSFRSGQAKRREISLKPSYDAESNGRATVKFKINGNVEHTAHVFDIPTMLSEQDHCSDVSVNVGGRIPETGWSEFKSKTSSPTEQQNEVRKSKTSGRLWQESQGRQKIKERGVKEDVKPQLRNPGYPPGNLSQNQTANVDRRLDIQMPIHESVRPNKGAPENRVYSYLSEGASDEFSLPDTIDQMSLADSMSTQSAEDSGRSTASKEETSAYSKLLSDKSLGVLASALGVPEANMLMTYLEVPPEVQRQHQRNHPHDVVSAYHDSLRQWKNQHTHDTREEVLYEQLLQELKEIHRNDMVNVLKKVLTENRSLRKTDFMRK